MAKRDSYHRVTAVTSEGLDQAKADIAASKDDFPSAVPPVVPDSPTFEQAAHELELGQQ